MTSTDIDAARDDIQRARARLSDTISQLSDRVTSPIATAKEKLNLVQLARDNPWSALAVAIGAGVLVATTGADKRVASAAVEAGHAGVESARKAAESAAVAARNAPSKSRHVLGDAADALAAKCAISLIASFRDDARVVKRSAPVTTATGSVDGGETGSRVDSETGL